MSHSGFEESFISQQLFDTSRAVAPIQELVPHVLFFSGFGNAGAVLTETGVVVIDTGNPLDPMAVLGRLRQRTNLPIHSIVYTHGHADHAANAQPILDEAAQRGDPRPSIVSHVNVVKHMDRYAEMWAHNDLINRLQFQLPAEHPGFPKDAQFVRPDVTYQDSLTLAHDGIHLHHYKGETDDGTWVHLPSQDVVFSGDLFISSAPNLGNPFKVQRFDLEWAQSLEQIAACQPVLLLPGHGSPLQGTQHIQEALLTTALALRYLHDEVVKRLNQGQWEEQIVQEVTLPTSLAAHWSLAPIYGDPRFMVRGIVRRYTGWYTGNPSDLFPAPQTDVARELVDLTGETALLERARHLLESQQEQVALKLLDLVLAIHPADKPARDMKRLALSRLAQQQSSLIARNILGGAAHAMKAAEGSAEEA
jgi:alkyl sulfatase BDS1-like metallo-beta-lactamase superfamily hydrolase